MIQRSASVRTVPACRLRFAVSVLALAATLGGTAAAAATDEASAPAVAEGGLGDIVVTAQKTRSTVQTTPIAISVYSAAELQRQDVHDLQSLSQIAPDVNFRQGAGSPVITIRGVSSSDTSEIGDPAVAVSTDGVFSNRPYALNASLYDLARVEVLRGPQGTLSGRNAVGGAINFITARPERTDSAFASVQVGNYETINSEAMFNLALSDAVQLRVSGQTRDNEGYRAIPPYGRADDERSRSARATLAFEPLAQLRGQVTVQYNHLGGVGQAQQLIPIVVGDDGNVVHEKPPISSTSRFPSLVRPARDVDDFTVRWQADYDLPFATITYLGGYNKIDYRNSSNNAVGYPTTFNVNEHPETINQELRIASDQASRFTWLAGIYYFREANSLYTHVLRPGTSGSQVRGNTYDYDTKATSIAGFATLGFKITPTLKLTGGVRVTHDKKVRSGYTYYADVTVDPVSYFAVAGAGDADWTKTTWHAGLDWQVAPENLVYAKFDTGYKPGGFTTVSDYGAETVKSWEIGSKNRFLGDRLQFNVAAFYEDYTGQQVNQYVTVGGELQETVVNAGRSRIYGIEPEFVVEAGPLGRLSASGQWLHARFRDFEYDGIQYAGNRLPQSPDLSFSLGLFRSFALASGGTIDFEARTRYQSRTYLAFTNYGEEKQGGYTTTNLNLAYSPASAGWKVEAYVRNLENSTVLTDALANQWAGAYRFSYAAPRTFGGKLSVWF